MNKHHRRLHTYFFLLFFAHILQGMKIDESMAQRPFALHYAGNNTLVVLKKDACTLINTKKHQNFVIPVQNGSEFYDVSVNKQGTKIALAGTHFLGIYNVDTGEPEWKKDLQAPKVFQVMFYHGDDNRVLSYDCYGMKRLQAHTDDSVEDIELPESMLDACSLCVHHPTKPEIMISSSNNIVYRHNYKTGHVQISFFGQMWGQMLGLVYNADGSACAECNYSGSCITILADSSKKQKSMLKRCVAMSFHSQSDIPLIFVLSGGNTLSVLNYRSNALVYERSFAAVSVENIPTKAVLENRIAISPNGKKIGLLLKDKWCVMPLAAMLSQPHELSTMYAALYYLTCYDDGILARELVYEIVVKKLMKLFA